ncbi:MAG TPA: NAD-dependent DNA ligase LigA [bacterium]|nr:NAD-dependent DNA ligase LigA [bacterium]HNS34318.1 NAD-dependent DNA ligase LigA [bacterium]HQA63548.1 NAD-dependent DNA ligase LigA [bacterium]
MNKQEAKNRIDKLKKQLHEIDYAYYVLDKPVVSDAVRDSLKDELEKLEGQHPELVTPDSPTQRIGGKALGKFQKHKHRIPKYSIDDVFSFEEVVEFDRRVKRFLNLAEAADIEYICELKIDGLNMSYLYKNGILDKAVTRGDGLIGEVVTHTVKTIRSVPLSIKEKRPVEVGGEVFMPKAGFTKMNQEQWKKGGQIFANPRNAAAGTVRQLDPKVAAGRDLDSYMYSYDGPAKLKTHEEVLKILKKLGFKVTSNWKRINSIREAEKVFGYWAKHRSALPFEIDGLVIKVNNLEWQERLGRTAKHIRWAVAYKFAAEQATTVVEAIGVQVGRTGALTPVAHLRPVNLAGSTIRRATLHNQDEIDRLDVRVGDTVVVEKAGDIIPNIIAVLPKLRTGREKKFRLPNQCPICGSPVEQKSGEVAYYCANDQCFAKQQEQFYHFVSRGAFNIDGLGPQILDHLQKADLIEDVADIFKLKEEDLLPLERFAEKSARNLIQSVAASKTISLAKFIFALGIRHVGEETAALLAGQFVSGKLKAGELPQKVKRLDLELVEGIGPKVAQSIIAWFDNSKNIDLLKKFDEVGVAIINQSASVSNKLAGKKFVLTGELEKYTRQEAKDKIKKLGGSVSSSVSKLTDYLVAGAKPGSKYDQAQKLGVTIIEEKEFLRIIK